MILVKRRYALRCVVFLLLTKLENNKEYILLQRRFNTGILDGQFDVSCSGHWEKSEILKEAIVRESKEEIGIDIKENNLNYVSTIHANFKGTEYLLVTFQTSLFDGKEEIQVSDKCNELKWVMIDDLPCDIIDTRKMMIDHYKFQIKYDEYGFNQIMDRRKW